MGKVSLSGYTKKLAISQLGQSLCKGDYDSSCYWSVEMHISGWINDWWIAIVNYCAINIHLTNPKIGKFLYKISQDYPGLRGFGNSNSSDIRQSLAMVVGVVTFSNKDIPWNVPKAIIVPVREEDKLFLSIETTILNHSVLRSTINKDPQFLVKLLSKMAFAIESQDFYTSLRTISICLYLDKHKFYKKKIICGERTWKGLEKKHWTSWILFVWDVLMTLAINKQMNEIIGSWRALYITNCSTCKIHSMLPYVISSIGLLCHKINTSTPCIRNEATIHKGCASIDLMYGDILRQYSN